MVWRYVAPCRSSTEGKEGVLTALGRPCVSRHTPACLQGGEEGGGDGSGGGVAREKKREGGGGRPSVSRPTCLQEGGEGLESQAQVGQVGISPDTSRLTWR